MFFHMQISNFKKICHVFMELKLDLPMCVYYLMGFWDNTTYIPAHFLLDVYNDDDIDFMENMKSIILMLHTADTCI